MYIFFTASLNENELLVMKKICTKAGLLPSSFINISKNELMPDLSVLQHVGNVLFIIADPTKSKPAHLKAFEDYYGKENLSTFVLNRISKPSTFLKTSESANEVWALFKEVSKGIDISTIVSEHLRGITSAQLEEIRETKKAFILENAAGKIEIRPEDAPRTMNPSVTYSEFLTMALARTLFSFDKVETFKQERTL